MPGKKKWIYCSKCDKDTWAIGSADKLGIYYCNWCGSEINLLKSKLTQARDRKQARALKAKNVLPEKKKKPRDFVINKEYMAWIKTLPCCVPGCRNSPSDAHHVVHRSQGRDDMTCVPLCHECHIGIYHGQCGSVEAFKESVGVDLREVMQDCQQKWATMRCPTEKQSEHTG